MDMQQNMLSISLIFFVALQMIIQMTCRFLLTTNHIEQITYKGRKPDRACATTGSDAGCATSIHVC